MFLAQFFHHLSALFLLQCATHGDSASQMSSTDWTAYLYFAHLQSNGTFSPYRDTSSQCHYTTFTTESDLEKVELYYCVGLHPSPVFIQSKIFLAASCR